MVLKGGHSKSSGVRQQKALIDKRLAEGLEDFKEGRVIGPFKGLKAAIRSLRRAAQ